MKKILCLLLLLMCIPCFAGNLQQINEDKFKQENKAKLTNSEQRVYMLTEDYTGYMNYKRSMYGVLLYRIDDVENNPNPQINFRYLNLMKNNIDTAIKTNNFNIKRIDVPDNEYKQLSKDTREFLNFYNLLYANY